MEARWSGFYGRGMVSTAVIGEGTPTCGELLRSWRPARGGIEDLASGDERRAQRTGGRLWGRTGGLRELGGDPFVASQGARLGTHQPAVDLGDADRGLDPGHERIRGEGLVVAGAVGNRVGDGSRQRRVELGHLLGGSGSALQGLADHSVGADHGPEKVARHLGDLLTLLVEAALAGERRRGADALEALGPTGVTHPPAQEGHVRALASAVGVQLVEDEEAQILGLGDELALVGPGQDQLQHHVVREQDVGRISNDRLALLVTLLAGVALESHRPLAVGVAGSEELLQLLFLAIGQGVHRVDDDRLDAPP